MILNRCFSLHNTSHSQQRAIVELSQVKYLSVRITLKMKWDSVYVIIAITENRILSHHFTQFRI